MGLAVVPSLIMRYWALYNTDASSSHEHNLSQSLYCICMINLSENNNTNPLSSPYYTFVDVWMRDLGISFVGDDRIQEDNFKRRLWFAHAMMMILAKRNFKASCRRIWPAFSQNIHEEFDLPKADFFRCTHSKNGNLKSRTFRAESWNNLVKEATAPEEGKFLRDFSSLAWIIAAYISIVPHRAWTDVLLWLDNQLCQTFYNTEHQPPD